LTETTNATLKHFGLLVGGVFFAVFGLIAPLIKGSTVSVWALAIGGLLLILAVTAPKALAIPYRSWMILGELLGWINSRIILGAVFLLVLTPIGILRRIFSPSHHRTSTEKNTYRIQSLPRTSQSLERPF